MLAVLPVHAWRAAEENAKDRRIGPPTQIGLSDQCVLTNQCVDWVSAPILFNDHYRCHDHDANCQDPHHGNVQKNEFLTKKHYMQIELQVGLWVFQWQLLQYMRAPIYASPGDIWFIKVILQKRLDANRDTLVGVEPLY